jgi:methyl-accepting chemotaxis protein
MELGVTVSIRTKVLSGVGAILLLLGSLGIVSWLAVMDLRTRIEDLGQSRLRGAVALANAQDALWQMRFDVPQFQALAKREDQQKIVDLDPSLRQRFEQSIAQYRSLDLSPEERQALSELDAAWGQYMSSRPTLWDLLLAGKNEEAVAFRASTTTPRGTATVAAMAKQIDLQRSVADTAVANAEARAQQATWTLVALALLALSIGVGVTCWLISVTVTPVRQLAAIAHSLAQGDLDQVVTVRSHDEIGELGEAFREIIGYQREMATVALGIAEGDLTRDIAPKSEQDTLGTAIGRMITGLREMIGDLSMSAERLAQTSGKLGGTAQQADHSVREVPVAIQQVAAGTQETARSARSSSGAVEQFTQAVDGIARGAQDQARQVQAATSTASRMATDVEQVAGTAQAVAGASRRARSSAEQGAQAVDRTVTGMAEIQAVVEQAAAKVEDLGKLGEKIGAVVETIDDIAEQTNLLALNAAIEAARAGEHGRGFAVVADEVRKLAERSLRETKAIADLIHAVQAGTRDTVEAMQEGQRKVEEGSEQADQAGRALAEILTSVEATAEQVATIAGAAQELARGAGSVVDAMQSISAVVEENTAATEQMAAQTQEVTHAMQDIATNADDNSNASEQVSRASVSMGSQVDAMIDDVAAVSATADQLRAIVAHFRLAVVAAAEDDLAPRRRGTGREQSRRVVRAV